jgi:Asp-tRNA(Asn)/Glu-tRNA(Gln) amidotransferase A subunit family amidase
MLDATAGPEPGEAYSAPHYAGTFLAATQAKPDTLKIGVSYEKWGAGKYQPEEYTDRLFGYKGDTGIYNQTGQPSISLPLYWCEDNLPIGMMFTGAYANDALLLQLASQLEVSAPWSHRQAPLHAGKFK